jgi:TM2 domain-containing membrane protein YozV
MAKQGSSGNVIAALCSFFIPGLGQLIQGRPFAAAFFLFTDLILWLFLLGWLMHIIACLDAAWYSNE